MRFSVAAAIERFRSENERGFLESRADIRYGVFGARGAFVYDIFSSVRDKRRERITTGELIAFVQATSDIRIEAGYREMPVYDRYALETGAEVRGPAIVEEAESTTVVPESWGMSVHESGALVIEKGSAD